MEKGDALLLRADARGFVDETNAGGAAPLQCGVEVVDSKADVVDAWAALGDEPSDG